MAERYRLLGVKGPMGECKITTGDREVIAQVFRLPDGSAKYIVPPETDAERAAIIEELRVHLGVINARRAGNGNKKPN